MKKIFLIIALILISSFTYSQKEITFGGKFGINYSGYHTNNGANTREFGINLGGFAEYSISNSFSLQTELLFNQKGFLIGTQNNSTNFSGQSVVTNLSYLDIPILLKIHWGNHFSFITGPQIGFKVNESLKINNQEITSMANNFDSAIILGFEYKFLNDFLLSTRYSYGLSKVYDNDGFKNSVISLSFGYIFH